MQFDFSELAAISSSLTLRIIELEGEISKCKLRSEDSFNRMKKEQYLKMLSKQLSAAQSAFSKLELLIKAGSHEIKLPERR
ncbi:hypothetical protein ACFWMP_26120 [Paenibacillus sp. NPDC058367]|uniref:hypothetical protein n=1 Tax=Paenibacillus sp. NPDC058367 TaxID=3346460 RepID=UPI003646CFE6